MVKPGCARNMAERTFLSSRPFTRIESPSRRPMVSTGSTFFKSLAISKVTSKFQGSRSKAFLNMLIACSLRCPFLKKRCPLNRVCTASAFLPCFDIDIGHRIPDIGISRHEPGGLRIQA